MVSCSMFSLVNLIGTVFPRFNRHVVESEIRRNSDVSISEMIYPNYLKFDVRIVLYQVPFQIKFEVILTNGYRDIDLGSWPKKRSEKMQTICR